MPNITKGVEGGGDFSIRMMECFVIEMAIELLAGGSNTMKTMTCLSGRDGEPSSIGGFGQDLLIHQKKILSVLETNAASVSTIVCCSTYSQAGIKSGLQTMGDVLMIEP